MQEHFHKTMYVVFMHGWISSFIAAGRLVFRGSTTSTCLNGEATTNVEQLKEWLSEGEYQFSH